MINEKMYALGAEPSEIREIFAYGLERKAQIGQSNVYDLSIGNPSVPSPAAVDEAIARIANESCGLAHGYTPSNGLAGVREAVASNLNARFGQSYTADCLYMTSGAAASLAISIKAIALPGEEVIVIAPYFTEYKTWIENAGCKIVEVAARESDFMIDIDALGASINQSTAAIIINSPNNPVGVVYSDDNLKELSALLMSKSEEYSKPIYLISDEPYRELVYDGVKPAWVPSIYDNTIVCYSWSKSFSLPGERIGYILAPSNMPDHDRVYKAICGAGRSLGYVCASTLFQNTVAQCIDAPVDTKAYDENRKALMQGLSKIGYEFIEPKGAFYLWLKALEPDARKFCERAKAHEILIVPSDGFGALGWCRVGYCASHEAILGSMGAFEALYGEYRA